MTWIYTKIKFQYIPKPQESQHMLFVDSHYTSEKVVKGSKARNYCQYAIRRITLLEYRKWAQIRFWGYDTEVVKQNSKSTRVPEMSESISVEVY